jgi:flagellar hook-associated protein 3 FlgL
MYSQITESLLTKEAEYSHLVEQMGSGRRVLSAGDDPLGASQAVNVAAALAQTTALANNRATAKYALNAQEDALASATLTMQSALERLVYAGNGLLNDTDRRSLATDLEGMRDTLIGLANSTDGEGRYMFAGYDNDAPAYSLAGAYLVHRPHNLTAGVQVSQDRVIKAGVVGSDVFNRANPGSNTFFASANVGNAGTALAGTLAGHIAIGALNRTVVFAGIPGALTYTCTRSDGTIASNNLPYVNGADLNLGDGLMLPISGQPVVGDSFAINRISSVDPITGVGQVNIFSTLDKLIDGLEIPTINDPVALAAWKNTLSESSKILQNGYDNILTVRSNLGSTIKEVEALDNVGTGSALSYTKRLSDLEDLNMVAAYSEMVRRQTALQAAGMAFKASQGLNLFQN